MKKLAIFTICTVVCFAFAVMAFAHRPVPIVEADKMNISEVAQRVPVHELEFKPIIDAPKWATTEASYPNNDFNFFDTQVPPSQTPGWNADLGLVSEGTNTFTGTISSTGFGASGYTGDTDTIGFSLPPGEEGILSFNISFNPDCDPPEGENFYHSWILAENTEGAWGWVDTNIYDDGVYWYFTQVTCPHELSLSIDPAAGFETWYVDVSGFDGAPTNYTIQVTWQTCWDNDEDGYYDEACGGSDCDDSSAFYHPCQNEINDNGIDEDCSGADRETIGEPTPDFFELEPNNDDTEAQDLGALSNGDTVTVWANDCDFNFDYYQFDKVDEAAASWSVMVEYPYPSAKTVEYIWENYLLEGAIDDFWFGFSIPEFTGDYLMTVSLEAAIDADGDGFYAEGSGGNDCDDSDPLINPCAFGGETLPNDGVDQNCNGFQWGEVTPHNEVLPDNNEDYDHLEDLGTLDDYIQFAAEIEWYDDNGTPEDPSDDASDEDWFGFVVPEEGVLIGMLTWGCNDPLDDLDLYLGFEAAGELWIVTAATTASMPDWLGFFLDANDLYELPTEPPTEFQFSFPQDLFIFVYQWSGVETGVPYHGELWFQTACLDDDGDTYTGPRQDYTEDGPINVDWEGNDAVCDNDCDDEDSGVNPGAAEGPDGNLTCSDGIDNDCDGFIDGDDLTGDPNCDPNGSTLAFGPQSSSRTLGHIGLILIPAIFVLAWRRRLS